MKTSPFIKIILAALIWGLGSIMDIIFLGENIYWNLIAGAIIIIGSVFIMKILKENITNQ